MASCLLDASAVLVWLFGERGAATVEKVLGVAALSTVNLAEVLYRADEEGMDTSSLEGDLESLGLSMEPFTSEDARLVEDVRRVARNPAPASRLATAVASPPGFDSRFPSWVATRLGNRFDLASKCGLFVDGRRELVSRRRIAGAIPHQLLANARLHVQCQLRGRARPGCSTPGRGTGCPAPFLPELWNMVLTVENTGEKLTPQLLSTRRNPHPRPPGRRRAPRHGSTTRRATADWHMTNRGVPGRRQPAYWRRYPARRTL